MAIFTKLKMLGLALALIASGSVSASQLIVERHGVSQIMAQLKEVTNAQALQKGGPIASKFSYQTRDGIREVNVITRPAARILIDGEPSGIQLHRAKVNEHPAVLMLTDKSMQLSYKVRTDKPTLYQVRFSGREAEVSIFVSEHPANSRGKEHGIDAEVEAPLAFRPTQIDMMIDAKTTGNPPIAIHVFKHDDVEESIESLTFEHFSWWVQQMNDINKRHISLGNDPLFSGIVVNFATDADIQSFEYRGNPTEKLRALALKMSEYKSKHLPRSSYRRVKFLLLTEYMIDPDTLGVAYVGGRYGIAVDDDDQMVAHELGHMFNGRHELADVVYNGWWCETILYRRHVEFRASCHRYTDENKNAIANYLSR